MGILIDDAIVVIENIFRHMEEGADRREAADSATSEIGLAVMATTFSIVAVFIPVAFMEGLIGRFFYQFGITVAFAVMISLFVSFTLTPMLVLAVPERHPSSTAASTASSRAGSTLWIAATGALLAWSLRPPAQRRRHGRRLCCWSASSSSATSAPSSCPRPTSPSST